MSQWQAEAEGMGYTENNVIHVEVRDMWKFEEEDTVESSSGRAAGPSVPVMTIIDESELGGQKFVELCDISELDVVPPPAVGDLGGCTISHEDQMIAQNNAETGSVGVFQCTLCPEGFDKKLLLNNHMKKKHGINFVFTERGRKVKLVRLPEEETPKGHASSSKDVEQRVFEVIESKSDNDEEEQGNNQGLGCGYAVKIDTPAYHKAMVRNEIPFAAFFPIMSSKTAYLLRIQEYGANNHLLEPATRDDVIRAFQTHRQIGSCHTAGDLLPIVAFVQQYYNHTTGATDIDICPPVKIDLVVKFLSQDHFTTLAFSNPVNNVSSCDPADDEEMDDEDPLPPPTPKPKRRGRRTKKEIEQARVNATKAAPSPNAPTKEKTNHQTENVDMTNLAGDEDREVTPTGTVDNNADNMPELIPQVSEPPLDVVETHNLPEMPSAELPPILAPMKVKVERRDEEEPVQLDESVLPITSPKTTPKSRKGGCKAGKGQNRKSKSTSKSTTTGSSPPKKPKSSRTNVKITNVKEEPMDLSQNQLSNTRNDFDDENDKNFVPSITCAPKRPPPAGPRRRGRPRKLKFDECLDN